MKTSLRNYTTKALEECTTLELFNALLQYTGDVAGNSSLDTFNIWHKRLCAYEFDGSDACRYKDGIPGIMDSGGRLFLYDMYRLSLPDNPGTKTC